MASRQTFEMLRQRWAGIITGQDIDTADPYFQHGLSHLTGQAGRLLSTMDTGEGRAVLWPGLPITGAAASAGMRQSYQQLRTLAIAYHTRGTTQHGDAAIADAVIDGLDWLHQRAYHAGAAPTGNWWDWEIGVPQALTDTAVLLHGHYSEDQLAGWLAAVARFMPDPTRQQAGVRVSTGANRSDMCRIAVISGILAGDASGISLGREHLADTFAWSVTGDGLHPDGSFIQHQNIPYTGTYGLILLEGLANLFALLAGTPWEITHPDSSNVYTAALNNYAPVVWNGLVFDAVRGRAVARSYRPDHRDGRMAIGALLRLAESATAGGAGRYRAAAKGWIQRTAYERFAEHATLPQLALAKAVLGDDSIEAAPEPVGHRLFPDMERVIHRRPGWAFVIAMSSARIGRYEGGYVDNENLRGWHTGAGMTYLYLASDPGHYADGFWPTVDPYRLPGTTIDTLPLAGGDGDRSSTGSPWSGGAALGLYGAAGMQYDGLGTAGGASSLRATKSWFCLDDSVIALGAAITAVGVRPMHTTIENRNMHGVGPIELTVDAHRHTGTGWQRAFERPRWAHLAGVAGYLLLSPAALHAAGEARTGSYRDIGPTDPLSDPITRPYCTIWIGHGTQPTHDTYAYAVLPGATLQQTADRADRPGLTILANTAAVQAVHDERSRITAANFFAAGRIAGITSSGPASIVIRELDDRIELAVADPSRTADTLTIELAGITIAVNVGGSNGKSHTVVLRRQLLRYTRK
ncbi:polysaccharide lyase 8 family protein [Dactylosporangium sp. CA-233914]|uniref:polysaccharide lyase 8 family protein n=1 Tax=Dactylosporangium sp. CA-233914 TaxID=3239934 RepID=UPI003D945486